MLRPTLALPHPDDSVHLLEAIRHGVDEILEINRPRVVGPATALSLLKVLHFGCLLDEKTVLGKDIEHKTDLLL